MIGFCLARQVRRGLAASVLCDEALCKFECQSDARFLECDQYVLDFAAGCC